VGHAAVELIRLGDWQRDTQQQDVQAVIQRLVEESSGDEREQRARGRRDDVRA